MQILYERHCYYDNVPKLRHESAISRNALLFSDSEFGCFAHWEDGHDGWLAQKGYIYI